MNDILIVEDEGLIALDLKRKLELAGYRVSGIDDNGPDALASVERTRPAMVMMDIRIHGSQDGVEVAGEIRRRFDIPVIFTTAHADRETLERARITEPYGYIVKPFHAVDFRAQIEVAIWKHKMEQKLRASEAWLSTTFRNTADALISTDAQGDVILMNPPAESLTGWTGAEARGNPLLEVLQLFEEATGRPAANPLNAIHEGRDPGAIRRAYKQFRRDGSGPTIVETVFSTSYADGQLQGLIVVFRDITAQRMAEKDSRRRDKINALAQLAAGLGEELAELQDTMDGALRRLISKADTSTSRLLGKVQECGERQGSIIAQLVELGTSNSQAVRLDLNQMLAGMEPKLRKALGPLRPLKLRLTPGLAPVEASRDELEVNLLRVLAEARKAMPDGGTVEISTELDGPAGSPQNVRLTIRDSGRPAPGATDRLLEPYSAGRGGQKPGLSLALVHRFVALCGGRMELENAGGAGAAYVFSFPAAEPVALPRPAALSGPAAPSGPAALSGKDPA